MIWVGYLVLGIAGVSVFLLSLFLAKCLLRKETESQILTIITMALSLTLSIICVMLIPVDVYNVTTVTNAKGELLKNVSFKDLESRQTALRVTYYVVFAAIFIVAFFLVPFSYCFYEEGGDDKATCARKTCRSMRYVIIIIIIFAVIFIAGLFMKSEPRASAKDEWIKNMLDSKNKGQGAIDFTLAVMMFLGIPFWVLYGPCGMSILPVSLLALCNKKQDDSDDETLNKKRRIKNEKSKAIASKYADRGGSNARSMDKRDRKALSKLERERAELDDTLQLRKDSSNVEKKSCLRNCCFVCAFPLRIILGPIFLLLAIFFVVSLVFAGVTYTVKLASNAKWSVTSSGQPMDLAFVEMAKVFPIDFIMFLVLVSFVFLSILTTFLAMGISCPCCTCFRVRIRNTRQQGVLLLGALMMFMSLGFLSAVPYIMPQYYTFGKQTYEAYEVKAAAPQVVGTETSFLEQTQLSDGSSSLAMTSEPSSLSEFISLAVSQLSEYSEEPTEASLSSDPAVDQTDLSSSVSFSSTKASSIKLSQPVSNEEDRVRKIYACDIPHANRTQTELEQSGFCVMTEFAMIMTRIQVGMAFFDSVFFVALFAFSVMFLLGLLRAMCRCCAHKPLFRLIEAVAAGDEEDFDNEFTDEKEWGNERGAKLFSRGKMRKRADYDDESELTRNVKNGTGIWASGSKFSKDTGSTASSGSGSGSGSGSKSASNSSSRGSSYGDSPSFSSSSASGYSNSSSGSYSGGGYSSTGFGNTSSSAYGGFGDSSW
ncbi:putative serine/threonine protein kinase [Monocercomonoides exilis]|uniref:putative serine/threonine protein kinase n=1 Tax=Monocercomonoides exilis TaxID=2049356 RepID=UPI0035597C0F|nr:putative serine/threonine protein kinase [Monocercomonoides exilis]|eukprot:MONOS_9568.1-p1 / transcript=MONOS_9568.1 / gene=MONOS_9568 / organism=Monocercomonoides_exilis_PA203 / gene_product=LMBR1-like conserved region-containing protein / transcript_product=LMBR1-like conserved region-containing protein / location=Mono_scaffold00400:3915-6462(-) / protein_length=765 / sequence_SO=supercontig / SO=protein_coding / is_pseudo=false